MNCREQQQKRVLDECVNSKLKVEERKEALSHLPSSVRSDLHKLKLQYSQLKTTLQNDQFKYFMSCGLNTTEWNNRIPITDNVAEQKDVNAVQIAVSDLKERLEASKTETEEWCDELELACDDFKTKLKTLEDLTREYDSEKQKLAHGLEISTSLLDSGLEKETEEIELRVATVRELNRQAAEKLVEVEENILKLNTELMTGTELVDQVNTEVKLCRGQKKVLDWCNTTLDILAGLSGIRDAGLCDSTWCVSIAGPSTVNDGSTASSSLSLGVSIDLARHNHRIIVKSVKVDNVDVDVSDVIKDAIETGDIKQLLTDLQHRWLHHYPIVGEIESLRKKYAMDWELETRTLTVMYGKAANIICILKVHEDYPRLSGAVILKNVICDEKHNLEDLKLYAESATLTDWLEHLQSKLDPRAQSEEVDMDDH